MYQTNIRCTRFFMGGSGNLEEIAEFIKDWGIKPENRPKKSYHYLNMAELIASVPK